VNFLKKGRRYFVLNVVVVVVFAFSSYSPRSAIFHALILCDFEDIL
jgi:hypothetical protein